MLKLFFTAVSFIGSVSSAPPSVNEWTASRKSSYIADLSRALYEGEKRVKPLHAFGAVARKPIVRVTWDMDEQKSVRSRYDDVAGQEIYWTICRCIRHAMLYTEVFAVGTRSCCTRPVA
jgi:hypothetical protein